MKALEFIVLSVTALIIYAELKPSQGLSVAAVSENAVSASPSIASAVTQPAPVIVPSTLTPMQLGSGLFENSSGLDTSPYTPSHEIVSRPYG